MRLHPFSFAAMGTQCEILLYADTEDSARSIAETAAAEVGRLERKYSRYRDDGMVAAINAAAARGGTIEVDDETAELLHHAFASTRDSGGLFDITTGLLRTVWDFSSNTLPRNDAILRLLPFIGMDKISWNPPVLEFALAGMEIDLGGIVKEYAADQAADFCALLGAVNGIVDLGGDVRVIGPHPDGSPWMIGIRHPRQDGALIATVPVYCGGLASSGDYERFFDLDGQRYCHLLNPVTGWPVSGLMSVSVGADTCLGAGQASSIAMLKGREGPAWLEQRKLDCIWVDENGRLGGTLPSEFDVIEGGG